MPLPRRGLALALAAALSLSTAPVALADPTPGDQPTGNVSQADVDAAKQAVDAGTSQVEQVQARLEAARAQVEQAHTDAEVATEAANAARDELTRATTAAVAARKAAQDAAAKAEHSQALKEDMAAQLYMRGGGSLPDLRWVLTVITGGDPARDSADVDAAEGYRQEHLTESRKVEGEARAAEAAAVAAEKKQQSAAAAAASALAAAQKAAADADTQERALAAQEKAAVAELARLRRTSVEVEQARQAQLAREAQQREQARIAAQMRAQATARAQAARDARSARGARSVPNAPIQASGNAAQAIAFAQAQLGKPYLWGGNGPGSYDCSGLMVAAWGSVGRALPRTAQWQYDALPHVALEDLQPGDLVFFGATESSIYHVGMFIGNGMMIEAPRTGLNIRYSSIYRRSLLPMGGRP